MSTLTKLVRAGLLAVCVGAAPAAASDLEDFFTDLVPAAVENVGLQGTVNGVLEGSGDEVSFDTEFFVTGGSLEFEPFNGLNQLGTAVFGQLQQIPVGSTVAGFTYEFDPNLAIFVRSSQGLGPVLAERAQTNGKGKLNLAFSYSHIDFDQFEGEDLGSLRVSFAGDSPVRLPESTSILIDQAGANESLLFIPAGQEIFVGPDVGLPFTIDSGELDAGALPLAEAGIALEDGAYQIFTNIPDVEIDTEIKVDLFALFANFGVTDWMDVGLVLPILRIDLEGKATTRRIFDPASLEGTAPAVETVLTNRDSEEKSGIGDIILRGKARLFESEYGDLAARADVSLPTGDEDNLFGRGNGTFFGQVIASEQFGRFSPHVNLGLFIDPSDSDQSQLRYAAGIDVRVHERVTIAGDVVGSRDLDSDDVGDNQVNVSGGLKVNVWRRLILSGNALVRLNDDGLRADVIPSGSIEYTFF